MTGTFRVSAQLQRPALDAAQDVDHPAVLEPHLVIEEPPELLGELADRGLGALGGVQPVVVNVPQARVAFGVAGELVHPVQQAGQLLLPRLGQQEAVERLERPALVRAGYRLPAAEHVVQQFALAAVPAGDLLPELPVELAEVLLHLAEVGEQLPCGARELLVAVAHRSLVEHGQLARLDPGDLLVDGLPAGGAAPPAVPRVGLGAEDDLPQQVEDRLQPRLGTHELALAPGSPATAAPSRPREWHRSAARRCRRGSTCAASPPRAPPSRPGRPWRAWGTSAAPGASCWFSAYSSSSRRLASSAAEMDRTLSATKTRCRKLSTSGALSARSSRHAGLLSRSHAISSTLVTTDMVGRRTDIVPAARPWSETTHCRGTAALQQMSSTRWPRYKGRLQLTVGRLNCDGCTLAPIAP